MQYLEFEDVDVGDGPGPVSYDVTTRQLVQYAGVSQDYTPIHYDTAYAQGAGHDDVIIHGALKSALIAQMLSDWTGDVSSIRYLETSYRGIDYAGQVTCSGEITGKRVEGSVGILELNVELRNTERQVTTPGKARIELPLESD